MRSFKVTFQHRLTGDITLIVETEVLVDDDRDARQEGADARRALDELIAGIGDAAEDAS